MESNGRSGPSSILYGGAFDPPHEGHRLVLARVRQAFPDAKILVIPGKQPAGAKGLHKTTTARFDQRVDMCRLAFREELDSGSVELCLLENDLPTPSYTLQTLKVLQEKEPAERWGLVMGRDQLESFLDWHQPLEILKRASLIVVERDQELDMGSSLEAIGRALGLTAVAERRDAWRWTELGTFVFPLYGTLSPAKSRSIRQCPARAREAGWIRQEVADYIESARLYT